MKSTFLIPIAVLNLAQPANSSSISWSTPFLLDDPGEVSNPTDSTVVHALDFNTPEWFGPSDAIINGIPFVASDAGATAISGFSTTMDGGSLNGRNINQVFSSIVSGDQDLDNLLNSHAWRRGIGAASFTLTDLELGQIYQVQLIGVTELRSYGVTDIRSISANRVYELDNGEADFSDGLVLQRGGVNSTTGRFVADGSSQTIQLRSVDFTGDPRESNFDPGLSGIVVLAVPEPTSVLTVGVASMCFLFRRRRNAWAL